MLGPIALQRGGSRRSAPPGDDPGSGKVTLLPEVRAQYPHVEILRLYSAEPSLEHAERCVDRDSLMIAGWSTRPHRTGVAAVLPEERSHPAPIALREPPRVAAEKLVDRVLVPPAARRSTIFDPASRGDQETEGEDRETQTAQTGRCCFSSWARSSRFSRRVLGVSSRWAQRTNPSGPMSTYARLEKNFSSIRVP
jgi:hypothetical protein